MINRIKKYLDFLKISEDLKYHSIKTNDDITDMSDNNKIKLFDPEDVKEAVDMIYPNIKELRKTIKNVEIKKEEDFDEIDEMREKINKKFFTMFKVNLNFFSNDAMSRGGFIILDKKMIKLKKVKIDGKIYPVININVDKIKKDRDLFSTLYHELTHFAQNIESDYHNNVDYEKGNKYEEYVSNPNEFKARAAEAIAVEMIYRKKSLQDILQMLSMLTPISNKDRNKPRNYKNKEEYLLGLFDYMTYYIDDDEVQKLLQYMKDIASNNVEWIKINDDE